MYDVRIRMSLSGLRLYVFGTGTVLNTPYNAKVISIYSTGEELALGVITLYTNPQ